jgi:hypothetical protein
MEHYVTYHKILDLCEDFQIQSPILKSFGYGNLVDFGKNTSGTTTQYPFMFMVPQAITYDENTTTYQFSILFADILNTNLDNEKDCVSDMSLESRRFISFIKRGMNANPDLYNYMDIQMGVQAIPFQERFNDHTAGVALQANIIVFEDINACNYYESPTPTPTNSATPTSTPTPTPTITPSATIPEFSIGDGFDNTTQAIFIDSSDNIFVGGVFFGYNDTLSRGALVKLDSTGVIDTTFNSGISTTLSNITSVNKIVEDETGNYIYVVGVWGVSPGRIVKVDKTTGLNVWSAQTLNNSISDIAVDSITGDVYIVGQFTTVNANTRNRIAHFNSAGVLQPTFTGTSFNLLATSIIINRNGNLVITGTFTTYNGLSANRIIEIERTTYTNTGFWGTGTANNNNSIFQRQDNGEYVIVGNDQTINGTNVGKVSKWTEAGVNIPYTTAFASLTPTGIYLDEVNNFIYVSQFQNIGIRRYEYDTGNTDTTFETNIGQTLPIPFYSSSGSRFVIQLDSNNKIYWVGSFVFIGSVSLNRIVRLYQNGIINTITT